MYCLSFSLCAAADGPSGAACHCRKSHSCSLQVYCLTLICKSNTGASCLCAMEDVNGGAGEGKKPSNAHPTVSPSVDSEAAATAAAAIGRRHKGTINPMQDWLQEALVDTGHVLHCALLRRKDGVPTATCLGHKVSTS